MIKVTKLNKEEMTINAIYVERVEATPDTIITLLTGNQYIVRESVQVVIERVNEYYRNVNLVDSIKEMKNKL
jgi:flagellar protein FlbD